MNLRWVPVLLFVASTAYANTLPTYGSVKDAILSGKSIHIVTDFSKCTTSQAMHGTGIQVGAFTPDALRIIDTHLSASSLHFTMNNPAYPNQAVYEFIRYTLADNDELTLTHQTLDANHFARLSQSISFTCKLGSGAKIFD